MTRIPNNTQAERMARMARSKRTWIADHGKDRPAHLLETEQENLASLEQAYRDYAAAHERDRKAEMMDG